MRRWFKSQRTHYGKLSKQKSGQAPREMTKRQSWLYQQMGFFMTHIRCKGANRSSGFEASPNTSRHAKSCGSILIQNICVLRESRSQPILTYTPVSTDSKILKHFDQMRTLISGFLQQKSDRQPFFDYVASEAEKMSQEIFRDIEAVKNTPRRQVLPRRLATITNSSNSYVYYTPSPTGFGNPPSVVTVQDEGSRHNLSGILRQLPDLTTTKSSLSSSSNKSSPTPSPPQHCLNRSNSLLSSQPVRVSDSHRPKQQLAAVTSTTHPAHLALETLHQF